MDRKLYLEFYDSEEDVMTFSIDDPKSDLDAATVEGKMNLIVEAGIFDSKGADIVAPKSGYIVEKTRTDIFS